MDHFENRGFTILHTHRGGGAAESSKLMNEKIRIEGGQLIYGLLDGSWNGEV